MHICSGYFTQVSEPWPVGLLFFEYFAFIQNFVLCHHRGAEAANFQQKMKFSENKICLQNQNYLNYAHLMIR